MSPIILLVFLFVSTINCARIIGIFMTPSYSHQIVFQPIWKELSLQGHQVTVVTPNPLNDPSLINLTEIDIGEISYKSWKNSNLSKLTISEHSFFEEADVMDKLYKDLAEAQLSSEIFRKLIKEQSNKKYDLFMVEYLWPVMFAFKDVFNCSMVGICSMPISTPLYQSLGLSRHPILNTEFNLPYATDLTYPQRVLTGLMNIVFNLGGKFVFTPEINAVIKKYFGENARSLPQLAADVSLVLENSNYAFQNIKPTVPQLVDISGIHLKEPKPLPRDLKTLLDSSKEGLIYFSLGTNVKSALLPPEKIQLFVETFRDLPYKVLWKFETENIPNLPKNVVVKKWVPQQDILAHPNVKLFIMQGGIQSIDEAIFSKIPVLVMPFFGDQYYNADMITKKGGGLKMNFHDFTSEEMREKILRLIEEKSFKEVMTKLSSIAFDEPLKPLEKAIWHINYVLRHNGTSHLEYKAKRMPLYQYYMVDVYGTILGVVFVVFYLLFKLIKVLLSFVVKGKKLKTM